MSRALRSWSPMLHVVPEPGPYIGGVLPAFAADPNELNDDVKLKCSESYALSFSGDSESFFPCTFCCCCCCGCRIGRGVIDFDGMRFNVNGNFLAGCSFCVPSFWECSSSLGVQNIRFLFGFGGSMGSFSFELSVLVDGIGGGWITFAGFAGATNENRLRFNVNRFAGRLNGGTSIFGICSSGSSDNS